MFVLVVVVVVHLLLRLRRQRRQRRGVGRRPQLVRRRPLGIRIVVTVTSAVGIVIVVEHHRRDVLRFSVPSLRRVQGFDEGILRVLILVCILWGHAHALAPVRRHRPRLNLVRVPFQVLVASVRPRRVRVVHVDVHLLVKLGPVR